MGFSLFNLPTWREGFGGTLGQYMAELRDTVVLADEYGWKRALTTEHHFHYYGGAVPNPAVVLSNWASVTQNIRLGACVSLIQLRNPLMVAEDYALVDQVSDGRCDMGVARGFVPHEFDTFEVDPSETAERISESLDICCKFWAGETFSHKGKFFQFDKLESWPPAVNGSLPIWNAASNSIESFKNAAAKGYFLMMNQYPMSFESLSDKFSVYCDEWKHTGRKVSERKALVNFMAYMADTEGQAIEAAKGPLQEHAGAFGKLLKGDQWDKNYASDISVLLRMCEGDDWKDVFRKRTLICTPEQAVERIQKYIDIGFSEISFILRFGSISHEESQVTMKRLSEEVLPKLKF